MPLPILDRKKSSSIRGSIGLNSRSLETNTFDATQLGRNNQEGPEEAEITYLSIWDRRKSSVMRKSVNDRFLNRDTFDAT